MSDTTKIEWADATWNPLRGCQRVSEGCRNCYAARVAARFSGEGMPYEGLAEMTPSGPRWTGKIRLVPEALAKPLRWRRSRRIFVNSMSDLFHEGVPFDFIDQVFAVMALAPQHTFMILTKRPLRMADYFRRFNRAEIIGHKAMELYERFGGIGDCSLPAGLIHGPGRVTNLPGVPEHLNAWPLPNVWLGVSVENQKAADERIPLLLQTPAAVRFLSMEPLLGPVNLKIEDGFLDHDVLAGRYTGPNGETEIHMPTERIDWVIAGGESGPGARPMHPDWVLSIRDQCTEAGVPFFFKQWGEWAPVHDLRCNEPGIKGLPWFTYDPDTSVCRIGKAAAGRLLDGREWNEFPKDN